jgi:hypothetical protein
MQTLVEMFQRLDVHLFIEITIATLELAIGEAWFIVS